MNPPVESSAQDKVRKYFRYVVEQHKLPSLPAVAGKVLQMIQNPDLNVQKLSRVLSDDAALAGRVLAVARSPYYAQRNLPTTLVGAVQVLGFRTLSDVVMATATHSLYIKGNEISERLWNHSLGVALAMRILSGRSTGRDRDHAFLTGLMHDVGEMILVHGDPRGFAALAQDAQTSQRQLKEKEQESYGFDHTQVGVTLLEAWNIDEQIREAVRNHHDYEAAGKDPKTLTATLICADYLVFKADLGFYSQPPRPDAELMSAFGCEDDDQLSETVSQLRAAYEEESALFRPA